MKNHICKFVNFRVINTLKISTFDQYTIPLPPTPTPLKTSFIHLTKDVQEAIHTYYS